MTVAKIAPQAHTRSFCVIHTTVDNISNNTASRGLSAMTDHFVYSSDERTNQNTKSKQTNRYHGSLTDNTIEGHTTANENTQTKVAK